MKRIIAMFDDHKLAVKAAGALLDHGVKAEEFDLVGGEHLGKEFDTTDRLDKEESKAEHGVTTTTKADAKAGAKKGGGAGLALGALAGLATLFIPGYGIVVGSGALATAIAAAVGTGAAGAIAGGVTGYLKDMGLDEKVAHDFDKAVERGGAIVAVKAPSESSHEVNIMQLLNKYRATRIETAGAVSRV